MPKKTLAAELQLHRQILERSQRIGRTSHWTVDRVTRRLTASPEAFRAHCLPDSDTPLTIDDLIAPFDEQARTAFADNVERLFERGEPFQFDADLDGPDGHAISLHIEAEPERNGDGRVDTMFGVSQDVTEWRREKRQLDRANRLMRRSFALSRLAYWSLDLSMQRFIWSPEFYAMFGATAETFDPTIAAIDALIHPRDRERVSRTRLDAAERRTGYQIEALYRGVDGRDIVLKVDAEPEIDRHGAFLGFFGTAQDITDQKRVEQRLAEANSRLERALRVGGMGYWRMSLPDRTLQWSPEVAGIVGIDPKEFAPTFDYFIAGVADDQRADVRDMCERAIAAGNGLNFDVDMTSPARPPFSLHIETRPERDDEGLMSGYFGIIRDITAERQAKRQQQETERDLRAMLEAIDASDVGVGTQSSDGAILTAGPALLRIAGFESVDQVRGRRWSDIQDELGGNMAQTFAEQLKSVREGDESVLALNELELRRPDGGSAFVQARTAPLPDGRRTLVALDISKQVRDRNVLAEREAFNRTVLQVIDSAGIGTVIEDHDGRIISVSSAALAMTGFESDEGMIGRLWSDIATTPEDRDRIIAMAHEETRSYARKQPRTFLYADVEWHQPSGRVVNVRIRSSPLPGIGRLVILTDMTAQRTLEREQKLTEEALHQAQKMEALGQLAGGVAHELNNMLHPILTFARAARKEMQSDKGQQHLDYIETSARRAAEVVRNTLAFARPSAKVVGRLDAYDLTSKVIAFSRNVMPSSVALEFEAREGEYPVRVNETEFTQVLINLVQNSVDAMQQHGIVNLQLEQRAIGAEEVPTLPPGDYVVLTVTDNGEGMDSSTAERIFEPFYTTKPSGKGTGLGLSVVYGIVRRWQGSIGVDSRPGAGTRMSVYIPRAS